MSEYEENEIEKELSKCSKKLLIKIIIDCCTGHPFNNLKIDEIDRYRKYEKTEKLKKKIDELYNQFINMDMVQLIMLNMWL